MAACLTLFGCSSPPTKVERVLYSVTTNHEPSVALEPVVSSVSETNEAGTVLTRWETNKVWVTNVVETYTMTPNTLAKTAAPVVGSAVALLGPWGDLASVVVAGALAVWGWVRSSRLNRTAGVLAQVIETGREVLKSTPQGREWDKAWVQWMTQHQAEEGVIENVMNVLASAVDNPTAKVAAEKLLAVLKERSGQNG